MPRSQPSRDTVPEPLPPVAESALLRRVEGYLKDLEQDPEVVREAIAGLGAEELERFGLRSYYMNLLAVFGDRWPAERVRRIAVAAARNKLWRGWEFHAYLTHLTRCPAPGPRLAGFDRGLLTSLLAAGRGLLVCSFHLGDYRDVHCDLALAGLPSTMLLDTVAFAQYASARETLDEPIARLAAAVDVERPGAVMSLGRPLAAGEIILAYVDGNTGQDGPLGAESRTEVSFLGYPIRIKNGVARLAARFGCPILPVLAPRRGGAGQFVTGPLIEPAGRLRGAAQERFAERALQRIYSFFEAHVLERPEQWESACFFHRWRAGAQAAVSETPPAGDLRRQLERLLAGGGVLRVNRQRIVEIGRGGETLWTDARTLKAYRPPAAEAPLFAQLAAGGPGVDRVWMAARPTDAARQKALAVLSHLLARQAITVADAASPGARP